MSKAPAEDRRPGLRRRVGAIALGGVSLACMTGAVYAYGGCAGRVDRRSETSEVATTEGGRTLVEQSGHGGDQKVCSRLITVTAKVMGSYTQSVITPDQFLTVNRPALILDASDDLARSPPPSMVALELSDPFFADEYSTEELCSTEEVSPSILRLSCLGHAARMVSIEVRIDHERNQIVMRLDGIDDEPIKIENEICVSLASSIPKRDLLPLQKKYLDDTASLRCASNSKRQSAPATFVRELLPATHDLYELGKLRCTAQPSPHCCRNVTGIRLNIPHKVAPSQNLGILEQQCGPCRANISRVPNGAKVECSDLILTSVRAFQLGHDLYIVGDNGVRQVSLPCGTILEFNVNEFIEKP